MGTFHCQRLGSAYCMLHDECWGYSCPPDDTSDMAAGTIQYANTDPYLRFLEVPAGYTAGDAALWKTKTNDGTHVDALCGSLKVGEVSQDADICTNRQNCNTGNCCSSGKAWIASDTQGSGKLVGTLWDS